MTKSGLSNLFRGRPHKEAYICMAKHNRGWVTNSVYIRVQCYGALLGKNSTLWAGDATRTL